MAEINIDKMAQNVAEKALDEFLYQGKSIREWMQIIVSEDCISRQVVLAILKDKWNIFSDANDAIQESIDTIEALRPVTAEPLVGHCKDCKWWKDSDGAFRRGIGAESKCPINREEVYEGKGYCFLYEPQESETWNGYHGQITAPKGTFERIFNDADDEDDI